MFSHEAFAASVTIADLRKGNLMFVPKSAYKRTIKMLRMYGATEKDLSSVKKIGNVPFGDTPTMVILPP